MPKLEPTKQIKLSKKVLQEILQNYNLALHSYKEASSGIENTTALVVTNKGKFAVRIYQKNKKKISTIQLELEFMNYLAKYDLPVPKVINNAKGQLITQHKDTKATWQCICMELMPGAHIAKYTPQLIKELAATQAKIHKLGIVFAKNRKVNPTTIRLADKEFLPKINLSKIKNREIKEFLLRDKSFIVKLDDKLPRGFNHNDFDHGNILVKNNKLSAVLDFDDLSYAPMAMCLGYTLWAVLFETQSFGQVRQYVKEYSKVRKLNQLELKSLRNIILFRHYVIGAQNILFNGEKTKDTKTFLKLEKQLIKTSVI